MRDYAEKRKFEGEAIDEAEEDLEANNEVYEARKKSFSKHRMFLDQFGKIVESRSCLYSG